MFPLFSELATNSHTLHRGSEHSGARDLLTNSSVQLCSPPLLPPHSLPWSSNTWYDPFKRLHVIPVCAGSSLRAAAHSTFSTAGALTFSSACRASFFSSFLSSSVCRSHFLCLPPLTNVSSHWRTERGAGSGFFFFFF